MLTRETPRRELPSPGWVAWLVLALVLSAALLAMAFAPFLDVTH